MQSIPGVIDTESGYANGTGSSDAHYNIVTSGKTGFKETVRVEYDPEKVSLDALLAYFYVIDPTVSNQQGNGIRERSIKPASITPMTRQKKQSSA